MSEKTKPAGGAIQKLVYWLVKNSCWLWGVCYNRLEIRTYGQGHFEGAALLVSNHQSNMDPPLIGGAMPCQSHFLAKRELFRIPVIGWIIATCNGIPLDRNGVDRAALKKAVEAVKGGGKLVLFPEGTRSVDGRLGGGKPGAGMIGAMAGAKCVPVYVDGSMAAMPRGAHLIRPAKIRIIFGEPFHLPPREKGLGSKQYYQQCADEMMERIAQVGVQAGALRHPVSADGVKSH